MNQKSSNRRRELVADLETERKLVEIFEKKIQAKLAEIWGEEKTNPITADLKTGDNHG